MIWPRDCSSDVCSSDLLKIGILTVIACCILLFSLLVSPSFLTVFSSKEEPRAFYRADIEEKKVALTFNISWGEERSEERRVGKVCSFILLSDDCHVIRV